MPLEARRGNTTDALSKREGVGRQHGADDGRTQLSKSVLAEAGGVSPLCQGMGGLRGRLEQG